MQTTADRSISLIRHLGGMHIKLCCIPPDENGGWSLAQLGAADESKRVRFGRRLGSAIAHHTGSVIYAPTVAKHSGAIVGKRTFAPYFRLANGAVIYRDLDVPSDGFFAERSESFMDSAAGCLLVAAIAGEHCLFAHGSRESLLDRARILTGKPSRPFEGLVESMVAAFEKKGVAPEQIAIRGYFGVKQDDFDHPFDDAKHGAYNRAMAADVSNRWGASCVEVREGEDGLSAFLSMGMLLTAQADGFGVTDVQCERPLPNDGPFAHTRHVKSKLQGERNLCVAYRSS